MRAKPAVHPRAIAAVVFLSVVLIWGSSYLFMSVASEYITPVQVSLLRVGIGLIPVALFAMLTRSLRTAHLRYLPHFLVMSVLSNSFYFWALAAGTYRLDTGVAASLSGSIPVFAFLASVFLLRTEKLTVLKTVGILVGVVGVLLLARPWEDGVVDPTGVGIMLLCALSYGLSFAYARRFITPLGIPAGASATYQMALGTLSLLIIAPLRGVERLAEDPSALWGLVLGLGFVGTGVVTVLYYVLVRSLGPVVAATTVYFSPFVAVLIGLLVLHEPFQPPVLLALGLLVAAALITRSRPRRRDDPPSATS